MRSTLSTRIRSVLRKSKNPGLEKLANSEVILPLDWDSIASHFRELLRVGFTEQGEVSSSMNAEWSLHHLGLKIDLPSEKSSGHFCVTYSNLCLKNKKLIAIDIPGELKLHLSKGEENRLKLESTETDSAILDAIVMGENLGLLNLMKRRLSGSCDLSTCENEIKKAIAHAHLSSARRISYSAALAAIEALNSKPSYAKELDTPYQEEVDKLVFAAFELYHEGSEHFSQALEKYASTIQAVKNELIEVDQTGTLNVILRRLEDETSAHLALSEIDTVLLTSIQRLMSQHRLFDSEKAQAFYEIVENMRLNIENEATFKNPEGLLQNKADYLKAIRADLKAFFADEKERPFSEKLDLRLGEAIAKINRLLYFKKTPLVDSMKQILLQAPATRANVESIDTLIHEAKSALIRESKAPQWQQFLRRWFQPERYQLAQFKAGLHAIADTRQSLEKKRSEIEKHAQLAIQNSKPSAWAFWRKTPEEKNFKSLESQAWLLCALQAFLSNEIQDADFITALKNSGHSDVAQAFQEKSAANKSAAETYRQEMLKPMADAFREPNTPSTLPKNVVELHASPRSQGSSKQGSLIWAEHQRWAKHRATPMLEPDTTLDNSTGLVH